MKKAILIFFVCSIIIGQNNQKEIIKHSDTYYWGDAKSENEKEAEDIALSQLTKQIAVTIASSYERKVVETERNFKENVEDIVRTFSTATLKNVKSMRNSKDGKISVFLYIEKSEVEKIFAERIKLIKDIYGYGINFEQEGYFGEALKNYYFAAILLNSLPQQNVMMGEINLNIEIPVRINSLINSIRFVLISDEKIDDNERELKFELFSGNKRINSLDFSFWDGINQVNIQAKDGYAIFRLAGSSINFNKLDLNIKYSYYESRNEISAVGEMWNILNKPSFKNSKQIELKKGSDNEFSSVSSSAQLKSNTKNAVQTAIRSNPKSVIFKGKFNLEVVNQDSCPVVDKIVSETNKLLSVLNSKSNSEIEKNYKYDSFLQEKLSNLSKFNKIDIVRGNIPCTINKTYDGWELRKIQVINHYSTLRKQTPEYIVLDFYPDGSLMDINFGIMDNLYEQFVEQGLMGNDWGNRQVIIKFVEKYRSAFLTRNIKTLDSLFADEAVIIVGRVFKKTKSKEMYKYLKFNDEQPDAQYMQYTKNEYMKNQARIFDTQQDIYLGYNTFKINRKNKQDGLYGISMRQNYQATSYSDEGYLFLLVDFKEESPKIYVRSWQPQEWSEAALIKLSNFNLNK